MANYKEIQGFPIQNLSSDPVPYAQELINNPYAGSWSSGGTVNTGRNTLSAAGLPDKPGAAGRRAGAPPSARRSSRPGAGG